MANITAKKQYVGKSIPVTMIDNSDGTFSEAVGVTFDGTLNLTVSPASIADGSDVAEGTTTDTVYSSANGSAAGTVVALLKGAFVKLNSIAGKLPTALGQTTAAGSLSVVLASNQGNVTVAPAASGVSKVVSVTPTISSGVAYSSGDNVGGILDFTNAVLTSGGTARLENICIVDAQNQKAAFDILFFDSTPGVGIYDDNVATSLDTDITHIIGRVSIATGDYVTVNNVAFALKASIGQVLKSDATSIHAVVTTTSTPTYTSTSSLIFKFGFIQD